MHKHNRVQKCRSWRGCWAYIYIYTHTYMYIFCFFPQLARYRGSYFRSSLRWSMCDDQAPSKTFHTYHIQRRKNNAYIRIYIYTHWNLYIYIYYSSSVYVIYVMCFFFPPLLWSSPGGLILEFYRGFNVSWTEADKYFDPPSSINRDWLKPCVETRLMITQAGFGWNTDDVYGDWPVSKVESWHQESCFSFGESLESIIVGVTEIKGCLHRLWGWNMGFAKARILLKHQVTNKALNQFWLYHCFGGCSLQQSRFILDWTHGME